jgi:leucyl-tRNA synthetase
MAKYDFKKIEKKWQKEWEKQDIGKAVDFSKKKKWYSLIEFPYPSGQGLHIGHIRSLTAMDIVSRKRRMEGYNVLYPIGWDAFGLPTENYAIKTGVDPRVATKKNTENFRKQLKGLGFSFDWSREVNTTDPKYYKWTQWLFLQFFKKGLAYKAEIDINWCPNDKVGLANEEVIAGKCERCGAEVEKRKKAQWMLKITAYADKLLKGLEKVDYLDEIKAQQVNWIGRSEGAELEFRISNSEFRIKVFTTRPDTLFGATYMVLAPEHELVEKLKDKISNFNEVEAYVKTARKETEEERTAEDREKTGVELKGVKAVNPATGEEIPVWIADYVLAEYGTGAIMAVPAHDARDFSFAKKFNLPIIHVVSGGTPGELWEGKGNLVNSRKFDGMDSERAKAEITKFVGGKKTVNYHLRDWVFSRQRYWGEPIPIIHCEKCGYVPVPEKDLPVVLPPVKNYKPRDDGESPLASVVSFVNVKCPKCKGVAKRETDTMPNWAGSSWYFLRYADPKNAKEFASMKKLKYWMPIDWYNGGMEHVTLHLLYSRFWNIFLHDQGLVPTSEPYRKRTAQGMILGERGVKMSKSRGNAVNPDTIVRAYGADVARVYEMFMGPFDRAIAWDAKGIEGVKRFLRRTWDTAHEKEIGKTKNEKLERLLAATVKKVGEDIEKMAFHTAISSMMIFMNAASDEVIIPAGVWSDFLKILAPFAPHLADELWYLLKNKKSVHFESWPSYDPSLLKEEVVEVVAQVNGKRRGSIIVPPNAEEGAVKEAAMKLETVSAALGSAKIKKVVYVKGRIINLVI